MGISKGSIYSSEIRSGMNEEARDINKPYYRRITIKEAFKMKDEYRNEQVAQDYTDDEILAMLCRIFGCGIAKHGSKVA